jgi:hypothetical protein
MHGKKRRGRMSKRKTTRESRMRKRAMKWTRKRMRKMVALSRPARRRRRQRRVHLTPSGRCGKINVRATLERQ